MSNERIDQIMHEHDLDFLNTDLSSFHQKIYSRTVKAMEQYGSECYEGGKKAARDICYEVLDPEITRLRSLVQAQKALIAIYEKAITLGDPDVWELYSKIQKLES